MRKLITILVLLGALYYAYDYFVVKGGKNPLGLPEPRPLRQVEGEKELRTEPGRGLNPFVMDAEPESGPHRPPMPKIPGAER